MNETVEEIIERLNREMDIPVYEGMFWWNLINCCLGCFTRNKSGEDVETLREFAKNKNILGKNDFQQL